MTITPLLPDTKTVASSGVAAIEISYYVPPIAFGEAGKLTVFSVG